MHEDRERDHALLAHFWALHGAVVRRDSIEDEMCFGRDADQEMLARSVAAVEAVAAARAALHRHLVEEGWTPPGAQAPAVVRDERPLTAAGRVVHA